MDSLKFLNIIHPILKKQLRTSMPIGILGQQKKASLLYTLDDNFDPVCFFCLPELHFRSEVFLTKNTNLEAMNKPAAMGQIIW